MDRKIIRSIRKGSAQWNEEDRLQLVTLLVKAGYCVKIGRTACSKGRKIRKTDRWSTPLNTGRNDYENLEKLWRS